LLLTGKSGDVRETFGFFRLRRRTRIRSDGIQLRVVDGVGQCGARGTCQRRGQSSLLVSLRRRFS